MHLGTSFGKGSPVLRSNSPLSDDQIMRVAPSIFAGEAHYSRSERYTYIPTIDVLRGLQREGFQPFMVAQTKVRLDDRREFTKHLIRLRHASDVADMGCKNEIILVNAHDGTASYKMLAGMLRLACLNGLICGEGIADYKVRHTGNVVHNVIEGAFTVLDSFGKVAEARDTMRALPLSNGAQNAFATAALALRYDDQHPAPVEASRLLTARRFEDRAPDLWTTFNRVQENMTQGGLSGRTSNGRRSTTRAVTGIDQSVKLNRALWVLAEEMAKLAA